MCIDCVITSVGRSWAWCREGSAKMKIESESWHAHVQQLMAVNRQSSSAQIEAELVRLRIERGIALCDKATANTIATPTTEDLFPDQKGLPEIPAEDLSGTILASSILHRGELLVCGLYRENHLSLLRQLVTQQERKETSDHAPLACSAHTLFHLLEIYNDCGLLPALREYLGANPVLFAERAKLRHSRAERDAFAAIPWHQDVNFLATGSSP